MDQSIDWVGVLSSIHGILPIVYSLWYKKITGAPPPEPTPVVVAASPSDFDAVIHEAAQPEPDADVAVDAADAEPSPMERAEPPGDTPVDQNATASKYPKENAKGSENCHSLRDNSDTVDMH